jgi:hypothetical protein
MMVNRSICGGRHSAPASFDALVSLTAWVVRFVCASGAEREHDHHGETL